jgi:hypothetical protein
MTKGNKMKRISMIAILVMMLTMMSLAPTAVYASDNFVANLSGGDEVPPRDTLARGLAIFKWSKDGTELGFTLTAANIDNVIAAHIHCGVPGVSGPVGVTLYSGGTPGSGRFDGVLAQGTKTAPDAGNACGWVTMADVFNAMNSGNTYVNIHTNDGVAPTNTGPGDFPGGEIRGQVH